MAATLEKVAGLQQPLEERGGGNERLREFLEQAPDGIFVADLDGRYTDVNSAGCQMLGYSREEIVGRTIVDLIPQRDVPRLWQSKEKLLAGDAHVAEWTLRRKDGSYLPVEVSAKILPDGRWQGFVRNITERKKLEEELRRAHREEHSLRTRLEQLGQAALKISEAVATLPSSDLATVLHTILLEAQALTGAELGALGIMTDPDKPFDPWVYSGVSDDIARAIGLPPRPVGLFGLVAKENQILRLTEAADHPAMGKLPPCHPQIHSLLGVPVLYRGKSVGNLYLANKKGAREFSPEDQITVELLASRAGFAVAIAHHYRSEVLGRDWLKGVIDQMPEAVVIFNEKGQITLQNQVALSMVADGDLGVDVLGNPILYDLRRPTGEPLPQDERPLIRVLKDRQASTGVELLLYAKGGRRIPVLVNATPILDGDSQITGAVAVFQDITAMKELQRLREEWLTIVAHDLRQPISVISGLTGMIASDKDCLPPETSRQVDMIASNIATLERMTHDLLDASRIEARQLSVEKIPADLRDIVNTTGESFRRTTPDHKLGVTIPIEPCLVLIDSQRIEQVLNNLLSNAAKYSDKDTEIELELNSRDHEFWISVSNFGIGLTAEQIENLFQRYYRTPTSGQLAAGIGLGLYIAKGLVEAHNGKIWAESAPGRKTTFTFSLPKPAPISGK
jgi:PAS domain S-box-containing protein